MSQVVRLPNNSYKPITNTAWFRARLCKLQKRVHSTRSRKFTSCLPMVGGSLRVFRQFPPPKLVAMIQLKVALNTKNQSINQIRALFKVSTSSKQRMMELKIEYFHHFSLGEQSMYEIYLIRIQRRRHLPSNTHECQHHLNEGLFSIISGIFQLYHDENKLIFNDMIMRPALYQTNTLVGFLYCQLTETTVCGQTCCRSLLFLLNTACLMEKQQISIL